MSTLHTPPTPWLESAYRFYGGGRDAVVSVSRSNSRAWNLPGIEIDVIHNGVDLRRWAFSPEPPRGAPLVWFGRLVPEKAPHLAIDAALLRDEHITIIGPAHDAAYFDRELRHRFKNRRVDWVGPVNHDELTRLVGRSAVTLCTPAWDEPFGLVVIESLACGTPVAALDRGAMRELLDDTTGAIADRNDAEGLARAIEIARRKHRQDCRRAVVNRFTLEAMLDGYESAMLQLAGSTR